jgi:hypothetical protein
VAAAADNLFLDERLDRRRSGCLELREQIGPAVSVDAPRLSGSLRGVWRVRCERGVADVTVALSPAVPPRVQTIEFERVTD